MTSSDTDIQLWFVVEIDKDAKHIKRAENERVLGIIPFADLFNFDLSKKNKGAAVSFYKNNTIMDGIVINAFDNQYDAGQLVEKIIKENTSDVKISHDKNKFFLVQFYRDESTFLIAVVSECDITKPVESELYSREVLVKDEGVERLAKLLHVYDSERQLQMELSVLSLLFHGDDESLLADDKYNETLMDDNPWLLVQCTSTNEIVYGILRFQHPAVKKKAFPNDLNYLLYGDEIFECIIVGKAINREDLEMKLLKLELFCSRVTFPMGEICGYDKVKKDVQDRLDLATLTLLKGPAGDIQAETDCSDTLLKMVQMYTEVHMMVFSIDFLQRKAREMRKRRLQDAINPTT